MNSVVEPQPWCQQQRHPLKKPLSLRNNIGSLQVRLQIDGRDAFINRLGRRSDPVAVTKAAVPKRLEVLWLIG